LRFRANVGDRRRAGGVGSGSGRFSQIVAADSGPSISGAGIGFVFGSRITLGALCAARPVFGAGPDCAPEVELEPPLPCGAAGAGALRDVESFPARVGADAGADESAGAVERDGAVAGALSEDDSARAGVASSADVVVASVVVVSMPVASAAAEVASSVAFICANLSPATAVNVAPAKKRAA
jgi:hypothetical protein